MTGSPGAAEGLPSFARLTLSVLVGLGVSILTRGLWTVRFVAGWNALSATQLALSWWVIQRSGPAETRSRARSDELARLPALVLTLAGGLLNLLLSLRLLRRAAHTEVVAPVPLVVLCFSAVVISWLLTHTAYTAHYARLFYREGGLSFPGQPTPTYWDFAYFAFTVGMCFQVSDVVAGVSHTRRVVLIHAFISYVYSVAVMALVVNVIAGMWT